MMFREKSISKLYTFALAAVFALTLAGCGGSGGGAAAVDDTDTPVVPVVPVATPQATCEADDGRWNDDMTCTSAADLETERIAAEAEATEADTDKAVTKAMAIMAEQVQDNDAGLGGNDDQGAAVITYSVSIERDSDGTEVEVADSALVGDAGPKFVDQMAPLGEGRSMHVRAMKADADGDVVEEVAIVATDIAVPNAVLFEKFEAADGTTPQMLTVNPKTTGGSDFQTYVVDNTADIGNVGGVPAASTGGLQTITYDDDTATVDVNERRFTGTYNGAAGTYVCTGNDACTATASDKGAVMVMAGVWTFTPAEGATSDQPDYDYLSWGVWLKKTTDKDGVTKYDEVEAFFGSSEDLAASMAGELDNVEGSATYEGSATGLYVHKVLEPDGAFDATSGHYQADVSLTANFSGQTIPQNIYNTVTGTVSTFVLSGGEENTWGVNLKGTRNANENTFSGTANGGGAEGAFNGMFFGETPVTPATDDDAADRVAPPSAAGEFVAHFTNGHVIGGFGANKK